MRKEKEERTVPVHKRGAHRHLVCLGRSRRTRTRPNYYSRVAELVADGTSKASLHQWLDMRLQSRCAYVFGGVLKQDNHPEELHAASLHHPE